MSNIVLTGLSGSGKTTLGRRCAGILGMDFFDMDAAIEVEAGMAISRIFAQKGEPFFREMEAKVAKKAAALRDTVISTGGGVVLREDNMAALSETGFVIFLDRPVGMILGDIRTEERPLLAEGAEKLRALSEARRQRYLSTAHAVFENGGGFESAVTALTALIRSVRPPAGYAVIGDPIAHSLSPAIHGAVFRALGMEESYHLIHVPRGRLAEFVRSAREAGIKGFNITAPHKQDVLPLLDHIDGEARMCGAVNTVVAKDSELHGYNTDMRGLLLSLRDNDSGYECRNVAVLGAGGAAAGIVLKAALERAKSVTVLARKPQVAQAMADAVKQATGYAVNASGLDEVSLTGAARDCDLLINTIPPVAKDAMPSLAFLDAMPSGALVCDIAYSPPRTELLAAAEKRGLRVLNGLGMLIHQAILADELYLGRQLDHNALYRVVCAELETKEETI